jgi:aminodeoxychorismate synthase component I
LHQHFDESSYCKAIETAKAHILDGDLFEICLTHRMDAAFHGDPWVLYQELRRINPSPFASFLKLPETSIVSSSPERFVRLDQDGQVESRPIKGTRPRGVSRNEDQDIRDELANSTKDRAENMMIVDLVRNDLGRVCEFGSVKVTDLLSVEDYSTVFQLVSTVQGKLRADCDAMDLVKAVSPGGSMTGAPKIEAMKIIDRLEPVKRGVYSGGIGYIDFSGTLDLSMVIRTLVVRDERVYINVGGAIVADSDPADEYQETMDKAKALIDALENLNGCGLA